jgi:hypothetical protein
MPDDDVISSDSGLSNTLIGRRPARDVLDSIPADGQQDLRLCPQATGTWTLCL